MKIFVIENGLPAFENTGRRLLRVCCVRGTVTQWSFSNCTWILLCDRSICTWIVQLYMDPVVWWDHLYHVYVDTSIHGLLCLDPAYKRAVYTWILFWERSTCTWILLLWKDQMYLDPVVVKGSAVTVPRPFCVRGSAAPGSCCVRGSAVPGSCCVTGPASWDDAMTGRPWVRCALSWILLCERISCT